MKRLILAVALTLSGVVAGQDTITYDVKPLAFPYYLTDYLEEHGIDNFLSISDRYTLSDSVTYDRIYNYNPDYIKKIKKQLKKFKNGDYDGLEIEPSLTPIMTLDEFRNSLKGIFPDPSMNMTSVLDTRFKNFHNGVDTTNLTDEQFIFGIHEVNLNRNNVLTIRFVDTGTLNNNILSIETVLVVETIDGTYDYINYWNLDKYSN